MHHPSFLRGVKFNFDEMQPNFLLVIIDPYRPQKGCETNVSRREIFPLFDSEFRTYDCLVRQIFSGFSPPRCQCAKKSTV